jgi:hypothetical protein
MEDIQDTKDIQDSKIKRSDEVIIMTENENEKLNNIKNLAQTERS